MIWTLARKELLTNLLTLRLTIAILFAVIPSVLTAIIGSLDFSDRVDAYNAAVREANNALSEVRIYDQVRPQVIVPPQPLSIFCKGVAKIAGQRMNIELEGIPAELGRVGATENWFMKGLVEIDFTRVVTLLFSFLAIVIGFDGICGERERGTLKLLLTHSISRGNIIVAKLLVGMLSLCIPLAIGFISALIIVLANPQVVFSGEDWLQLILFFICSCLFLSNSPLFYSFFLIGDQILNYINPLFPCLYFNQTSIIIETNNTIHFSHINKNHPITKLLTTHRMAASRNTD